MHLVCLVSHYTTIPRLAILFLATPPIARWASGARFFCDTPLLGLSLDCDRPFLGRSGGVAAMVCDDTGNAVRQGYCYTCLAIGGGISVGSLSLQPPRPATGKGPGQKCLGSVPGVCLGVSLGPSGESKKCPESVPGVSGHLFDTLGTLSGHFLDTPEPGARRARETPRDTPGTLRARRARETPVAGRGVATLS